jgi:PAS domain S-box-containing protein
MANHGADPYPDLYRLLIEQTKDYALFLLDPVGRILTWNAGAERIKGYAPEEIIGRHFSIFYPRQAVERGWPAHELKVATAEGRFEDEGWRIRKDGSRFWAHVVITALRDESGKLLGFSKITQDRTERKQYEEALRQSEERFRLLVEGVVDYAIYMIDPEGIVTSWNAGAERIKGYRREEIIGKSFSLFYRPEDVDAGKPWEELALARRVGRAEDEGWRVRKSGEHFWARVVVTTLRDAEGRLHGFTKVTQDLTERRHIEDLESAAKNVSEFIAMLAHELRNPLAPIRSAVRVMAGIPAGHPAHDAMLQTIDRQSAQLARIVDDLLDISRITRGLINIEQRPVDVADVVRGAVETVTPFIGTAGHTLVIDVPEDPVLVRGDSQRLVQLVANLLSNAARYTADGGSIGLQVRSQDGHMVLEVRDNGRGIEPELLDRVFDMFTQGREAFQRFGAGLGVGLALARKIAELHGGSLEAHSEGSDKGSTFVLRIPFTQAPLPQTEDTVAPEPPRETSIVPRKVLLVDDNVDAATALDLLLKSLGHETLVAHDGAQAVRMAADFHPDIVLLDIGMPGMDGYEVARRLRSQHKSSPIRIVAVTGWGQETDRRKSREAGFDLHLVKPVDVEDLVRVFDARDGATLH